MTDRAEWLAQDAVTSANANPSAFGVARGAIAELHMLAEKRSDARMRALADGLIEECRLVRRAAYACADDPEASIDRRVVLRARSLDLVVRAATGVVVARAGAAMLAGQDAERRVREAMFLQVQAQTAPTRNAALDLMIEASRRAIARD